MRPGCDRKSGRGDQWSAFGIALGFQFIEEADNQCSRIGELSNHDIPDQLKVNAEVVMNELVPHPGHLPPWHTRRTLAQWLRDALGGLANNLQVADDGILDHRPGEELIPAGLRISECPINGISDVQQIDALVLQSATASARIRSRR